MIDKQNPSADQDEQRNEVLLAYVEAYESGNALNRAELLAANPSFREELQEFFDAHEQMERLAVGLRENCGNDVVRPGTTSDVTPDIGQLGDFRLLREIGRGGMGVVYEAEQVSLRRRVALKLLPFAAALDPRQLQRFKNEALAAAHLRHENIVPVFAVGEDRGVHYYAMQFIDGRSLAALIAEMKLPDSFDPRTTGCKPTSGQNGSLPSEMGSGIASATPVEIPRSTIDATSPAAMLSTERISGRQSYYDWVASLGKQAALALEYAHSVGIVHRDIKPANLLLDPQGQLWVTDFGLAQVAGDSGLTMTGELLGTVRYASPEQLLGRRGVVDHRSDIYALGATLYELLTLAPIFDGRDRNELLRQIAQDEPRPPRMVHPTVPRELETIVLKALSKEPSERYSTARELADDLQRYRDHLPILARRPGLMERLWKLARRYPSLVGASVAILTLLTAGSLFSTFLIRSEQQRTKTEQKNVQDAYVRERQRAEEAEARFLLARRSVDEMFRISQEELADRPGQEVLRKRMLSSVLVFYREFLEERRDNPQAQAELIDAKQRVEKILADLAVLHAASQLYLLRQEAVLADLSLDDEQRPRVKQFCHRVGKEWVESFSDVGQLSPRERGRKAVERAKGYESELSRLLTAEQRKRLQQIGLQAAGLSAFGQPEIIAELKLTDKQREQIRMIEEDSLYGWIKPVRSSTTNSGEATSSDSRPNERVQAVLTEEQVQRWNELTGKVLTVSLMAFPPPPSVPTGGPSPRTQAQ